MTSAIRYFFPILLVTLLVSSFFSVFESKSAETNQPSKCFNYDFDTMLDPTTRSLHEPEPAAMEGQFPDYTGQEGSSYRVSLDFEYDHVSDVSLDRHDLVFGNVIFDVYGDLPRAPADTIEQVEQFLAMWSVCAATANPAALTGFIDSNSFTWLCDGEDRFDVQASPLALTCFGSGARTRGSLPLELYFVGLLSDGRAVAIVGEGTNHDGCGIPLGFRNYVSIWVLELNGDDTLIRAAIGGLEVYSDDFTVIGGTSCTDTP